MVPYMCTAQGQGGGGGGGGGEKTLVGRSFQKHKSGFKIIGILVSEEEDF